MGGRPLKPQNICPFKGISSWYAQNPLQGCQCFTGSHSAGMLVKTELWRGGVHKLVPAPTLQYSKSQLIPLIMEKVEEETFSHLIITKQMLL